MTNKNKPNVKTVTGNVNKTKIGFTKKFKSANTIATSNEVSMPLSSRTPFIKCTITITKMAVINILISSFIMCVFILKFLLCQKPCRFLEK